MFKYKYIIYLFTTVNKYYNIYTKYVLFSFTEGKKCFYNHIELKNNYIKSPND